jgi:hypothetical protein
MDERRTYLVVARPADDGHAVELVVPELGDTHTAALDLVEGEVFIRQTIALAIDTTDTESFDVEIREADPEI